MDNEIWNLIHKEAIRQHDTINLIASENICPEEIRLLAGSILCNKYAEGTPKNRYYAGCTHIDEIEELAQKRCLALFNAEDEYMCNVQSHAGTQANQAVYIALLNPGDRILSMDFSAGGHLSHGHKLSITSQLYSFHHYSVDQTTHILDYDEILKQARTIKPHLIIAGASSYSRTIDYEKFSLIAKEVGALLLADIAHIAGIIAAGLHPSPVGYADAITFTTHKTLRGARGACIIAKKEFSDKINRSVMPGIQGGPFLTMIAGKATTFLNAQKKEFIEHQKNTLDNARYMADLFMEHNVPVISNGTDNHLFVVNTMQYNKTGLDVEKLLEKNNIIVNRNAIPFDTLSPRITSGIRIGTPFITSQHKSKDEIKDIILRIITYIKH